MKSIKNLSKLLLVLTSLLYACNTSVAQFDETHTKWTIETKELASSEFDIVMTTSIESGWHIYAAYLKQDDGPIATTVSFEQSNDYELIGKLSESTPQSHFDDIFGFDVGYHEGRVVFTQRVKLLTSDEVTITLTPEFQVCLDDMCLFPPSTPIQVSLKRSKVEKDDVKVVEKKVAPIDVNKIEDKESRVELVEVKKITADAIVKPILEDTLEMKVDSSVVSDVVKVSDDGEKESLVVAEDEESSITGKVWWVIFLTGFGWGFAALFTPCVFPLIPMNVSFFLKRNESKSKGRMSALLYMISIIAIFVSMGLGISAFWGGGALNDFATSVGFNIVIFILLLVFAASFLGAFEITLPSGFVNKIDQQSDRGGLMGIFFMALTLVVVSFSCTGPMVGNALVAASTSGNTEGAFWAMFGFSSGLALPFGFFAFFPSLLNAMPKSGGWLNSVKVVLGFLELALALKFASNVDLVYQLGILTREVFLALWIAIFAMMSLYLMGKFKTSHDSDLPHLSVTRLFFAVISISFTIYLLPGMWGAPLKLLSGVLPPYEYSESPHGFGGSSNSNHNSIPNVDDEFGQYIEVNKNGIIHFKNDYEKALAYARKVNKPLLVDFTGRACANCRKTEDFIWPDAEVKKRLNESVVLVSLYVDERSKLPESEHETVFWYGRERKIITVGDKYKFMEETLFSQSTQPLYVLLDTDEKVLNSPRGYNAGITKYVNWLDSGVEEFQKRESSK